MAFVLNISVYVISYRIEPLWLNALFSPQKKIWHDIQWIRHTENFSETCAQPTKMTGVAQVNPQEQNGYKSWTHECLAKFWCMWQLDIEGLCHKSQKYSVKRSLIMYYIMPAFCETVSTVLLKLWTHFGSKSLFHYWMQKCLIVWKSVHSTPKTSNSNIKLSTRKTFFSFPKAHRPLKQGDMPEVNNLKVKRSIEKDSASIFMFSEEETCDLCKDLINCYCCLIKLKSVCYELS